MRVDFDVNGAARTVDVSPWKRLLDVLRDDLQLTDTAEGCGDGDCGACTVMLDGEAVNSCLVAIGQCDRRTVTTVDGLAAAGQGGEVVQAVQRALVAAGGTPCSICAPGISVCAVYVVDQGMIEGKDDATARTIVSELLAGNTCRCTGYPLIVDAVIAAARASSPNGPR